MVLGGHPDIPGSTKTVICARCGQRINNDEAAMQAAGVWCHVMCPPDPVKDQNGVTFGWNCMTRGLCKRQNLCNGTCKLF